MSGQRIWPQEDYLKSQVTDYNTEKDNYPENPLFYVNQVFLTVQKSNKMYYTNRYILSQATGAANVSKNIHNYECAKNEVKMYRPESGIATGEFLGLYKTVGLIIVRRENKEAMMKPFANFDYDKVNSKLLFSYQKRRIPNSFSGTLFSRHNYMIENVDFACEY